MRTLRLAATATVPSAVPPKLVIRSAISSICSKTASEILSNNSCSAMKCGPLTFQCACLT